MYRSLQACRAIAAALVVLFHLGGTFAQDRYFGARAFDGPFAWGDAGVEFFFVLSGFLITYIHRRDFGHPRMLGRYLAKRTLRIYPTYWVVCIAVCLAAVAFPPLRQALPNDLGTLLAALTLAPLDPAVVGGTGSPIIFVAWSLQYEIVFYAIVALAIVHRLLGLVAGAALLLMPIVACHAGTTCGFPMSFLANDLVLLFGFGVATAYLAGSALSVPAPRLLALAGAIAFVAFGVLETRIGRDAAPIDRRLVYGLLSSVVVLGAVRAEDAGTLALRSRWITLLGDASYALYLIHIPIISVLIKLAVKSHATSPALLAAIFVAIFAACVGAAVLFHVFVERPMLAFLGQRLRRDSKVPSSVDRSATPGFAARAKGLP